MNKTEPTKSQNPPSAKAKSSPVRRSVSEISPGLAVPEDDPPISDAGVGSTAKRVERYALGALNLVKELDFGILEQVLGVSQGGDLGPSWHVHCERFEVREVGDCTVPERVDRTVQR